MPKCQWRERPGDDALCTTLADEGREMCPRHEFLYGIRKQQRELKHAAHTQAREAGVAGRLPQNRKGLVPKGYQFTGTGECAGCGRGVEWWKTPIGRKAPFDRMMHDDATAVIHFATCPKAQHFRRAS